MVVSEVVMPEGLFAYVRVSPRSSQGRCSAARRANGTYADRVAALQVTYVGELAYDSAWDEQRRLHGARVADDIGDTVLCSCSTPRSTPRGAEPLDRPVDGTPVIDVDRGGKITWHGPGQLVGYPIVALQDPVDVVAYVRRMEQMLIDVCAEVGLEAERGGAAVWVRGSDEVQDRKVAAIGIRVSRRHDARLRPQLRLRPVVVRPDRAVRNPRCNA